MKATVKRPGITLNGSEADIWVWAPNAQKAAITWLPSGRKLPLTRQQYGY
jgi:hypothetical protein